MLTHAFLKALLYLDFDRRGFEYPVIPIQVNCDGKDVVSSRGAVGHLDPATRDQPFGDELAMLIGDRAGCESTRWPARVS